MAFIRKNKRPLADELINTVIAGRAYQILAIRAIFEAMEEKRKRFLLVMAMGTGKTRTCIAMIVNSDDLNYAKLQEQDIQFAFSEDSDRNSTWNWLFNIEERYNLAVRKFSYNELRTLKRRFIFSRDRNSATLYEDILDFEISN